MTVITRATLAVLALTVLAAGAGGWLGVRYGESCARSSGSSLNDLLHHQLDLSPAQRHQLAAMEASYAARRSVLEDEARAANHELATALLTQHHYGPQAEQAIDHFHAAMKTLEQQTVMHVLAMRSVLTPGQAKKFDQTVAKALDSDHP